MKNLLVEIKKCAEKRYENDYQIVADDCSADGVLELAKLMALIENLQEGPAACIAQSAPHYKKDLKQLDLQILGKAHLGDNLVLEARFYEIDKRQVELKIFVRKIKPDKSSKRVCRTSYFFKATFGVAV